MGILDRSRYVLLLALLAATVPAFGQSSAASTDPSRAALQKWLEQAWADGFKPIKLAGYRWEFEVESRTIVEPAEMERMRLEAERLRANVKAKPDHPDRMKLIEIESGDTLQPRIIRYTLWDDDRDQWRVSRTPPTHPERFDDVGRNVTAFWLLTPQLAVVWDPAESVEINSPKSAFLDFRPIARLYLQAHCRELSPWGEASLTSNIAAAATPARIEVFPKDGDAQWSARLEPAGKNSYFELSGSADASGPRLERIIVRHREGQDRSSRDSVLGTIVRSDFRPIPGQSGLVPWSVRTEIQGPTRMSSVTRLRSIDEVNDEDVAEAVRVPAIDRPDALRGAVRLSTLDDRRADGAGALQRLPDGKYTQAPTSKPEPPASGWMQVAGWTILAGLLVALLGVVFTRRVFSKAV